MLGPVPDEKFGQLVQLGKLITDYAPADEVGGRGGDLRRAFLGPGVVPAGSLLESCNGAALCPRL